MEYDSWSRITVVPKRHQSRHDAYSESEEMDFYSDEESHAEYPCPFCSEDFDFVGLCCHIDIEHPIEAKIGVCPVCQVRFGVDMVAHLIVEHENYLKMQRRRKIRKGSLGSRSAIAFLKKEMREENLQSLLEKSSYRVAPSNPPTDPLLSSFINLHMVDSSKVSEPVSLVERSMINKVSSEKIVESIEPSLSNEDLKNKARRSEFVQELLLSTLFDDLL